MTQFTNIDRTGIGYDIVAEIDAQTYETTTTGDGHPGYAFEATADVLADLRRLTERVLGDAPLSRVERVEATPGYVRSRVVPDAPSGRRRGVPPKNITAAVRTVAREWNDSPRTTESASGERLDGLRFGDVLITAVRPEGAPSPAEWVAEQRDPADADGSTGNGDGSTGDGNALADTDEPLFTFGEGDPDAAPDLDGDRYQPVTAVVPLALETFETVESSDQYDDTTFAFDAEVVETRFREYALNSGRWGRDYRLSFYPAHIRVDALSGSLRHPPAKVLLDDLERVLGKFNRKLPKVVERVKTVRHPEIQVGEAVYVAVRDTGRDVAAEWIDARGLDDVDGTPTEPDPEPEPEDEDADDTGEPRGAVETVMEKAAKQMDRRHQQRKNRSGAGEG